jgi:hypothetical protein
MILARKLGFGTIVPRERFELQASSRKLQARNRENGASFSKNRLILPQS